MIQLYRKIASRECASPLFSWLNGGLSRQGVDVAFDVPQVPGLFRWLAVAASASELSTRQRDYGLGTTPSTGHAALKTPPT